MQPQSFVSFFRQHVTCATCAVALVSSLAMYHKTVLANPAIEPPNHSQQNSTLYTPSVKTQYCQGPIAIREIISVNKVYQAQKRDAFGSLTSNNTKFNSLPQSDRR
jgi:hypothetical protein